MRGKIFAKLAKLEGKKVQEQLLSFAGDQLKKVQVSNSNDVVYGELECLNHYTYRVPTKAFEIIDFLITNKEPKKAKKRKSVYGRVYGKTHKELVIKSCELLEQIRYYKPADILEMISIIYLTDYSKWNESQASKREDTKKAAMEVIEKLASYNPHVIRQIGIEPQRILLDTMLKWSDKKIKKNIDIVQKILSLVLSPSARGFSMTGVDTFTHTSSVLMPDKNVEKLRKDAIDLAFKCFGTEKSLRGKIEILSSLHHGMNMPMDAIDITAYEKVQGMVLEDVKYLVSEYKKILFKGKKILPEFPIVHEIESQFITFELNKKTYKKRIPEVWTLLERIRGNKEYEIYRTIVQDHGDIYPSGRGAGGRHVARDAVQKLAKSVTSKNISKWLDRMKKIASYAEGATDRDRSKYNNFRQFIVTIAHHGDESVVEKVFSEMLQVNSPLRLYAFQFFWGLRCRDNVSLWDKYVDLIIKSHKDLIYAIFGSLSLFDASNFREKDMNLIEGIVNKTTPFSRLNQSIRNDSQLRIPIFSCLVLLLKSNLPKATKLMKIEIESYPELFDVYADRLESVFRDNTKIVKKLSSSFRKLLFGQLVEIKRLTYREEQFLLELGKADYSAMMGVFKKRMKKEDTLKVGWLDVDRYEAIPYNIMSELNSFITEHKDFEKVIWEWIQKMKGRAYGFSRFFNALGSKKKRSVLLKLIRTGKKINYRKFLILVNDMSGSPDFDVCLELVKKLDPKKDKVMLARLEGYMGNTGVVSGWDGLAVAYERKAKQFKEIYEKEEKKKQGNKKIINFCKEAQEHFEQRAESERQSAEESRRLREIEFESSK